MHELQGIDSLVSVEVSEIPVTVPAKSATPWCLVHVCVPAMELARRYGSNAAHRRGRPLKLGAVITRTKAPSKEVHSIPPAPGERGFIAA